MKLVGREVIVFLFVWVFTFSLCAQTWIFVKEKDGVQIFTRKIEGSSLLACRGVSEIDAPVLKVYTLVEDLNHIDWWDKNIRLEKMFFYEKNKRARYYITYKLPYPLIDRDLVVDVVVESGKKAGVYKIIAKPLTGAVALRKNYIRIRDYLQVWTLTAQGDNSTKIEMECLLDPAGSVPDWLINMVMVNSPANAINNIRKQLE